LKSKSSISIIIPAHKLDDHLRTCLHAIEKDRAINRIELVIVLDGITDTHAFFDVFSFSNIRIISLDENYGPAYARNEGAKKASRELLFFLDSDVEVHEDTIDKVITFFDTHPKVDALIGSYDDQPKVKALVSSFRNLLHHHTHQQASDAATTFWGACGAIRRKAFQDIGGFDTSYPKPSIEDIELGYRLIKKGYQIVLKKDIQIKHLKRWTLSNMIYTDIFRRAKPWTKLLLSNPQIEQHDLSTKRSQRWASVLVLLFLISLTISLWVPELLIVSILSLVLVCKINYRFYSFLSNRFSYFKFLLVIALHGVYYLSAMTGLLLGFLEYSLSGKDTNRLNNLLIS